MDENGLSHVSRYSWNKREIVPEALTSSGRMDGVLLSGASACSRGSTAS